MQPIITRTLFQPDNKNQLSKSEAFVLKDDLKSLTSEQKKDFYLDLCNYLGISSITKPFGIYEFQGKEVLYIKADAFDQLCAKNKVSRKIMQQEVATPHGIIKQDFVMMGEGKDQAYLVKVEASIKVDGELVVAEDIAEVLINEEKFEWSGSYGSKTKVSKGYSRNTNALMKAVTKAYRRAAKKLISLGPVMLEDDVEREGMRDLNLQNGAVVGGSNQKDVLDVALPKAWKGFNNLSEIDKQDSEKLFELYTELKSKQNLPEEWKSVLEVLNNYYINIK